MGHAGPGRSETKTRSRPGWAPRRAPSSRAARSEEHTSELQSHLNLVCRLLLEKKKKPNTHKSHIGWFYNSYASHMHIYHCDKLREELHLKKSRHRLIHKSHQSDTSTHEDAPSQ